MFSTSGIVEALAKFLKLDGLIEHVSGYVEARIRLLKIEVREDMAKAITHGLQFAFLLLVAFLFIIFLSIALALFLNRYFAESYVGFGIVALIYLVLFLLAYGFRKQIHKQLEDRLNDRLKGS